MERTIYLLRGVFSKINLDGPKSNPASLSGIKVSKLREISTSLKFVMTVLKEQTFFETSNV